MLNTMVCCKERGNLVSWFTVKRECIEQWCIVKGQVARTGRKTLNKKTLLSQRCLGSVVYLNVMLTST